MRHFAFHPYRSEEAVALQNQLSESIFNDEMPQGEKE